MSENENNNNNSNSNGNIDISDSDISESAPTVSRKEQVSSKVSGFRSGVSSKLDEHKESQTRKKAEKFVSNLERLGKEKETEEKELELSVIQAKRQELEQGSRAKVRALQQKDQQPSILDRVLKKTLTRKPVTVKRKKIKVTPKKKVKITKKNKSKRIVKKRKSKVKVSKTKTITIKLS